MKNLDSLVYENALERETLEHLLETLDHINPVYMSRADYDEQRGEILQKTGNDKLGDLYDLYLPEDLKVGEVIFIINLIVNTFKLNNGELDKLVTYTKVMIGIILRAYQEDSSQELERLKREYNIPDDFISRLRQQKDGGDTLSFGITKQMIRDIKTKRNNKESKQRLGMETEDVKNSEQLYSSKLEDEFDLTFFRKAVSDIRYGLEIIIASEQEAIIEYCEDPNSGFTKTESYNGSISYEKGEETITIHNKSPQEEAQRLRDKIGVDRLKYELEGVRKTGDQEKIAEKELEVAIIIAEEVFNGFNYHSDQNHNGYQINKILTTKQVYCVGFSIIGHAFFTELGIEHRGLDIPGHSALEVIIGGKVYLYDAMKYDYLYEIERYLGYIYQGDPEKILLSQVFSNYGVVSLWVFGQHYEAIEMYDEAIRLNPMYTDAYYNKGNALRDLGQFHEAIEMYDEAIRLNPMYTYAYNNKGNALRDLGQFHEAIEMYDEAIRLNPMYTYAYYNKGNALRDLGQFHEAIEMYDETIRLNPKYTEAYNNKGDVLEKLQKCKGYFFYKFAADLLKGKKREDDDPCIKEKQKIRKLIEKEDYDGLRLYLLELEKEEISN